MSLSDLTVAVKKDEGLDYCRDAPFHPYERYPEYPFEETGERNDVYGAFRELLHGLGMDRDRYGTAAWDPLGTIISPGDNVLIKPNMVIHYNPAGSVEGVITHGSVIRAALDYAWIALKGRGSITIADAPDQEADFGRLVDATGLDRIRGFYAEKGIVVNVFDLRKESGHMGKVAGRVKEALKGDPMGYTVVDLGENSELSEIEDTMDKFRVADYDVHEMGRHHGHHRHEFCIANSVLKADVIINLPKLKTHGKTGMTCALKNLVGINGHKDWLPHYRAGSVEEGGDEYLRRDPRKAAFQALNERIVSTDSLVRILPMRACGYFLYYSKLALPFKDDILNGSCHTNDTITRTIADLNRIAFYAGKDGTLNHAPGRRMFIVVDGVVGGENEGPTKPSPKKCGVLVAGHNPVAIDIVCSRIMGFDYRKMPVFGHAMGTAKYRLFQGDPGDIDIISDRCRRLEDVYRSFNCSFTPARGWIGHIELERGEAEPMAAPTPEII
jgi:uncharacterized protein (DUF362 family)